MYQLCEMRASELGNWERTLAVYNILSKDVIHRHTQAYTPTYTVTNLVDPGGDCILCVIGCFKLKVAGWKLANAGHHFLHTYGLHRIRHHQSVDHCQMGALYRERIRGWKWVALKWLMLPADAQLWFFSCRSCIWDILVYAFIYCYLTANATT